MNTLPTPSQLSRPVCLSFLLVFLSGIFLTTSLRAQTCTAIANGNWTAASTWSCNRAPANGDKIIIPAGKTVTVDATTAILSIDMDIYGTLNFASGALFNAKNMTIDLGRTVNVFSTGVITGGNGLSGLYMVTGYLLVVPITNQIYSGIGSPITGPKSCILGTCLANASLPIELLSFKASYQASSHSIRLDWITLSETNNHSFTVERGADGVHFSPVISLSGAGTTHEKRYYQATDEQAPQGINYYRLQQTDLDGTSSYSKVVAVEQPTLAGFSAALSPNPSDGRRIRIELSREHSTEGSVQILDYQGSLLYQQSYTDLDTQLELTFDRPWSNGLYWIKIRQGNREFTQKWVVINQ